MNNTKGLWGQEVINHPWMAILVISTSKQIVDINKTFSTLFGYEKIDIVGYNSELLFPNKQAFTHFQHEALERVTNDESINLRQQLKHKDGHLFWVRMAGSFIKETHEIVWSIINIDQAVQNEIRLTANLQENTSLANIVKNASNGIFIANYDSSKYMYANDSALKMLGYTLEEFLQLTTYDINQNLTPAIMEALKQKFDQKGTLEFEALHTRKDGSTYPAQISAQKMVYQGVEAYVVFSTDITHTKQAQNLLEKEKQKLLHQAHHDALTGLPNRTLFLDRLHQAIKKATRQETQIAVLFIDLDHFKEINDSLGHDIGDKVLQEITTRMKGHLRDSDTIARLGGDEFTVILENLHSSSDISNLLKLGLSIGDDPIEIGSNKLYVGLSVGISMYPQDGTDEFQLLKNADAAMYKAKRSGRNGYQFYDQELTQQSLMRVELDSGIRNALKYNEFNMYYQPQIDAKTNTLLGMEALIRWEKEDGSIISPDDFIPHAHESNLIKLIDKWVIRHTLHQIQTWHILGLNVGKIAINLSIKLLQDEGFFEFLEKTLRQSRCNPRWIELEITESQLMTNPTQAIKILHKINTLGIGVSIDDFGTGYSSLSYLKRLPINKLKIDRSFIVNLPYNKEENAIATAVIALANALDLEVIAEGVEEIEQRDFLVQKGCHLIQGYLYSKPLPINEIEPFLNRL